MDFAAYVGLPYKDGGRDRSGCDCWGVLKLFYAEQLGIALESFAGRYEDEPDANALADVILGRPGPWREVAAGAEQPGDGVWMIRMGRSHVGIVAGSGLMLHIERGEGSVIESYRQLKFARRLRGFYRYTG